MKKISRIFAAVAGSALSLALLAPATAADAVPARPPHGKPHQGPLVIAHRGASGYRPEHTMGAYQLALQQCADYIEPDLVMTRDGVLVDRHENEIGGTTNVAEHPEFADRKTTKTIDGTPLTGWFTEDFTLAELKTLRAVERLPQLRRANTAYNGRWDVPTFEEDLQFAAHNRTCSGNRVGIIPEIKHGTYFDSIKLSMEEKVVDLLSKYGYGGKQDPSVIQSFEVGNLKELRKASKVKLVQLIDCSGGPADLAAKGDKTTYKDMVTPAGLKAISKYADQVSFCKDVMIPRNADGTLGTPTPVIADAHKVGLEVVGWTFRAENNFLPKDYRSSENPADHGDLVREIQTFLNAGMDHFFTDNPDLGVTAVRTRCGC